MLIGVLALQGDVREHLRALAEAGAQTLRVRRPGELERVDALVIPGGESTTIAKLARTFELFEPVRQRIADGMPTYGSCAGMILLADRILDGTVDQETFGGIDMTVRRNAFGSQVESFEETLDSAEFGAHLRAVFIRAPWVESVGEGAQVLATVATGPAVGRIVAVRQRHLLATSFHPELTADGRVHRYFVGMVEQARGTGTHCDIKKGSVTP